MLQYLFGFLKLLSPIGSYLRVFFLSVFFFQRKNKIAYHKILYVHIEIFQYVFWGTKKN